MSQFPPPADNPYRSPTSPLTPASRDEADIDRALLKKFHDQITALGAAWIILPLLGLIPIVMLWMDPVARAEAPPEQLTFAYIVGGIIAAWVLVGAFACAKQLWAVYAGLALSYLSLIGNVITLLSGEIPSILGLVFVVIFVIQGHRVVKMAKQLGDAGVPLTAKP